MEHPGERTDPLTGERSIIVGSRQDRPNLPSSGCPFCVGGLEAPEAYEVAWFPNRWPPLPDDRAEVVLYAPEHDASLATLPVERVTRLVGLWADRTRALGARDDVGYVLVFENRGPEVGATIPHPHGQIYAFREVPPTPAGELAAAGAAGTCAVCTEEPGDRLVAAAGDWRAWVPDAASWPYSLLVAPATHVSDLPEAAPSHADLAALLVDVFGRLDRLFGAPMPLMWWWHQRPTDGGDWPTAHVHAHIAPLLRAPGTPRFVAAGELGSGLAFNPVEPAAAAAELRRV
jgi:UDPglucose--hexose-1-phosphate uridylyltransferase